MIKRLQTWAVAAVIIVLNNAVGEASDWPHYLGPTRDGVAPSGAYLTHWPEAGLEKIWSADLGEGGSGTYSGAAVVDGLVYIMGRDGEQDLVFAFDLADGQQRWKIAYEAPGRPVFGSGALVTPTVHKDKLYTVGRYGQVKCLAKTDGTIIWEKNLLTDLAGVRPQFGYSVSPYIEDDGLYLLPGGKGTSCVKLNPQTGEVIWQAGEDNAGYATPEIVKVNGQRQLLTFMRSGLVARDPATGAELWRHAYVDKEGKSTARPTILNERRIVIGRWEDLKGDMVGLDVLGTQAPFEIKEVWRIPETMHLASPILGPDYFIVHDGGEQVVCVNFEDGKVLWKVTGIGKSKKDRTNCYLIRLDERHLLGAIDSGEIVLLEVSREACQVKARFQATGKGAFAIPAIASGMLVVRDIKQVYCFRLGAVKE